MSRAYDRVKPVPIQFHRIKAALALQRRQFQDLCRALKVSSRHAQLVFYGARTGSAALLDAIRCELGEAAWLFATGQVDSLPDEESRHATV